MAIIDHVTIVVSDLDRSIEFYVELLGFRFDARSSLEGDWINSIMNLENVKAEVAFVTSPEGGARIELLRFERPKGKPHIPNSFPHTPGLRHIAFKIKNMEDVISRLEDAGVSILSPPIRVPHEVVKLTTANKALCYFHDPDGILVELAEYHTD